MLVETPERENHTGVNKGFKYYRTYSPLCPLILSSHRIAVHVGVHMHVFTIVRGGGVEAPNIALTHF